MARPARRNSPPKKRVILSSVWAVHRPGFGFFKDGLRVQGLGWGLEFGVACVFLPALGPEGSLALPPPLPHGPWSPLIF